MAAPAEAHPPQGPTTNRATSSLDRNGGRSTARSHPLPSGAQLHPWTTGGGRIAASGEGRLGVHLHEHVPGQPGKEPTIASSPNAMGDGATSRRIGTSSAGATSRSDRNLAFIVDGLAHGRTGIEQRQWFRRELPRPISQ